MPGYVVTMIDIDDHEKFSEYARAVGPTLAKYGGRVGLRGPIVGVVEGHLAVGPDTRLIVLEFPTLADARRWYDSDEYKPLIAQREAISSTTAFLIDGVELVGAA
jgi:uncharacterized protein (DUF1330 family)